MSIIAWIVLGLISGLIASKLVNKTGEDIVLDLGLGIVGAVVGGFMFNQLAAVSRRSAEPPIEPPSAIRELSLETLSPRS